MTCSHCSKCPSLQCGVVKDSCLRFLPSLHGDSASHMRRSWSVSDAKDWEFPPLLLWNVRFWATHPSSNPSVLTKKPAKESYTASAPSPPPMNSELWVHRAVAWGGHCGPFDPFEHWADITRDREWGDKVTTFWSNLPHRDIELKHLTFT